MVRDNRARDDNYAGPTIGRADLERIARNAHASNGRAQWIHDHLEGHLCTSTCGPLPEPAE